MPALKRRVARRSNDVWTIDFKGWFRTADGARIDPLTVRDLHSRYLLLIAAVPAQSDRAVRGLLTGLFRRRGLPRAIRVDNGVPFGGGGVLGLSTLSVWWLRLGIQVEFGRPAQPQDNGAHEQMHRILKAETAAPPSLNAGAQHRRFQRWRHAYRPNPKAKRGEGASPPPLHPSPKISFPHFFSGKLSPISRRLSSRPCPGLGDSERGRDARATSGTELIASVAGVAARLAACLGIHGDVCCEAWMRP